MAQRTAGVYHGPSTIFTPYVGVRKCTVSELPFLGSRGLPGHVPALKLGQKLIKISLNHFTTSEKRALAAEIKPHNHEEPKCQNTKSVAIHFSMPKEIRSDFKSRDNIDSSLDRGIGSLESC